MKATIESNDSSGNTSTLASEEIVKTFKINARNVMLTVNNKSFEHLEDIVKYLQHFKALNYLLVCSHDKPDLHYHIYGQYESARNFDSRYLYGAHIEKCFGSAQQCIEYCKGLDDKHQKLGIKCNVVFEQGAVRERGGRRIKDIMEMTDEEVLELDGNMYQAALKIRAAKKTKVKDWHKPIEVIYIWGPSGAGKSLKAVQILEERGVEEFTEIKHVGEFWLGIIGASVTGAAIYDDFRDTHMKASEFINFIDYNRHILNYKGGSAVNNFNLIIITSVQDPEKIYRSLGDEPRKQWLRRMKIIKINQNHTDLDDNNVPLEDDHGDALWQKQLEMLNEAGVQVVSI